MFWRKFRAASEAATKEWSMASHSRFLADISFADVAASIGENAILCLPLGASEQHGPHLPLSTDTIIAAEVTRAMIAHWGERFDLWALPPVSLGLSREHQWAPGTMSLSIATYTALLRDIAASIVSTVPARNLVLVNGHGGNQGFLHPFVYELQHDFGLNVAVIHPLSLAAEEGAHALPDIHAGCDETALMLVFAPHLVQAARWTGHQAVPDAAAIRATILQPGVIWPWSSGDERIAECGVIGDPAGATAERGRELLTRIVERAGPVFERLRDTSPAPAKLA
jgi:creatinine amidohydrolase